jgi:hypothetical protein
MVSTCGGEGLAVPTTANDPWTTFPARRLSADRVAQHVRRRPADAATVVTASNPLAPVAVVESASSQSLLWQYT